MSSSLLAHSRARRGRWPILVGLAVVALLTLALGVRAAPAAAAPTVVSLTFDDGTASEFWARTELSSRGMHGTFYVNSSRVGTSDYYMDWNQLRSLNTDGNQIAGHTAMHVNLAQTDSAEAQRQICSDRVNLVSQGLPAPTDFAYPYGAYNANVQQLVQACGYNSARSVSPTVAESIPPADPYAIRQAPGTDFTSLKNEVIAAEQQNGAWAPLVFHQICNGCDTDWISQSDFSGFLTWLKTQVDSGAVVVKTVHEVIGGGTQPPVAGPAAPAAPNGWNVLKNRSLEYDSNADSAPDCWQFDSYGTSSLSWSRTSDSHSGSWAERVDVSNYTSGDAKLEIAPDLGYCTPTVTPGHRYVITQWYKSSAPVTFAAFTRDTMGAFSFWTSSDVYPASSTWTQASWTTPVIPAGVNGLSFALTIAANGFLTIDDAGMTDAAPTGGPDTTAPTASLTSPTAGSIVAGSTQLAATAADNVSVDHVDFLVDGALLGSTVAGPYALSWNTRKVANGTHTVQARAVDTSGNVTTTPATSVTVSNSVTNLASNASLESATGTTPTCWQLGGYGNNSFTWTRTSDSHTGGFAELLSVSGLTDGDRKMITAQDAGTCSIPAVPGHSYSVSNWYKTGFSGLPVMFAYYRNSAGAWTYWSQSSRFAASSVWKQATWSTPVVPAGATAISLGMGLNMVGGVTMDDFSIYDNAPPPDVTPPTSTILCNTSKADDGGCISGYYNAPVPVTLSATDDPLGSGVASIRYTTDGSDPTATHGTVFSGQFTVGSTTTVKYRAFDNAGNAEAINSQLIRIDTTPPASVISCGNNTCGTGYYANAVSVALSATDTGGSDVRDIRYTTDGSDPTAINGSTYLGPFSATSTTTVKYRAYDNAGNAEAINTQVILIDTTAPTSTISCGLQPCSTSPYFGTVSVTLAGSDAGSGLASLRYTTDGTDPDTTTGTTYTGAFNVTATTTVKYRAYDNAGNAEPVNSQLIKVGLASATLTAPTDGATVQGTVNMNVAVNGINVDHVDFLVDGTKVGTASVGPYTVGWDSTTVPDGPHVVIAHVFDTSNVETDTDPATVNVSNFASDTTPPTSTIACNGGSCGLSFNAAVSVQLSASDGAGGSGVQAIKYTTDGTDPTLSNGTTYSGSFSVSATTTVKYRAYDNAGNAEATNSQVIQIDTVAPTSSVSCNAAPCASTYYANAVAVALTATDTGGSGVATIRYTTDGTAPTATNGSTYASPFSLTGNTMVKYRAYDNAGNAEPINSAMIRVDTTAPQSTIKCNGGACSGYFKPGASVSLSATDTDSGVASIKYTTDGTDPSTGTGTTYSSAFTLNATTTVKYRAFDNVGNAEAVNTQQVQIDGTAPTATLTAPTAGSLASGTVTMTANAADNVAVDHVDFLVDGSTVGNDATAPYSFDWSSASVADGTHTLAAKAVDGAGNTTTSAPISVVVVNKNLLTNPSLETATGSTPTCWLLGGYGTNTFTWTRTADAHTGSFAESLAITAWTNGDRKLVSAQDTGTCAPAANPGHTYTVTAWYKSANQPTIFAYYRNGAGAWTYWSQSPALAAAPSYAQAKWTTPAVPSGAVNISVGIGLLNVGSVTADDLGLFATG